MMKRVTTVRKLNQMLNLCAKGFYDVFDLIQHLDIPKEAFDRYCQWDADHYTTVLIGRNEKFEVVLTCWEVGQCSFIHHFNAQKAWTIVLEGHLREERFLYQNDTKQLEKVSHLRLSVDDCSFIEPFGIHRYSNASIGRTVSLSICARPEATWHPHRTPKSRSIVREAKGEYCGIAA